VLILDEATANLDFATEREIRGTLLRRPARPTTLVIAHRFSMVEDVDYVYVLDRGRVVEHGTVAELEAGGGWFAAFARSAQGESGVATDQPGAAARWRIGSSDRSPQ
jgi:ABC-type multidrug transport system fused ATPase/permease subunit